MLLLGVSNNKTVCIFSGAFLLRVFLILFGEFQDATSIITPKSTHSTQSPVASQSTPLVMTCFSDCEVHRCRLQCFYWRCTTRPTWQLPILEADISLLAFIVSAEATVLLGGRNKAVHVSFLWSPGRTWCCRIFWSTNLLGSGYLYSWTC